MENLEVIRDRNAAAVALDPVRSRMLAELSTPRSASALARTMGIARQKINYHLRTLESHGLAHQAESKMWGGITERMMVATATSYVISPAVLGPVAADPAKAKDRLSANYLIAIAARVIREVGDLVNLARKHEKDLATLSIDTEIRFASPKDRAEFSDELTENIIRLVSKYHVPSSSEGRDHRLIIAAHPKLAHSPKKSEN